LESQVVTHVDLGDGAQAGMNLFNFKSKDGTTLYGLWAPMRGHSHEVSLTIVGTMLKTKTGITTGEMGGFIDGYDLSHSHEGTAKFNEDGTVTITINSVTSFNNATATTITSDSVTATQWYKDKI